MGNRLSKIYTRTGDAGDTGLGDGSRVGKDDPRVEAYGDVDELNSALGVLLSYKLPDAIHGHLIRVQHDLFNVGGELCIPGHSMISPADIERLERLIDHYNADLPHLKEFILPGGGLEATTCHFVRAVCRRAERRVVALQRHSSINGHALTYLNRLSDLLFVLARVITRELGKQETLWQRSWN